MEQIVWFIISIVGYSLAGILFAAAVLLFFKMNIPAIIGDLTGKTAARQIEEIREKNAITGNKRFRPNAFNLERGSLTEAMSSRIGKSGKIGRTAQSLAQKSKQLDGRQTTAHNSKRLDLKRQTKETSRSAVSERLPNMAVNEPVLLSMDAVTPAEGKKLQVEGSALFANPAHVSQISSGFPEDVKSVNFAETEVLIDGTEVLEIGTEVLAEERGTAVLSAETELLTDGTEVLEISTEVLVPENRTTLLTAETEVLTNGTEVLENGTEVLTQENGTTVLNATSELINEDEIEMNKVQFKIVKDIKVIHTNEVI